MRQVKGDGTDDQAGDWDQGEDFGITGPGPEWVVLADKRRPVLQRLLPGVNHVKAWRLRRGKE